MPRLAWLRGVERALAADPLGDEQDHARWRKQAALAARLSCPPQTAASRENCEVLKYWLDERVRRLPWLLHQHRLDPIMGEHLGFAALIIEHDVLPSLDEADKVLARANYATARIDAWTDWLRAQRRAGIRPPNRMLAQLALQISEGFLVEPDQQILVQAFRASLLPWESSRAFEVAQHMDALRLIVRDRHMPAWSRLLQAVRDAAAGSPEDFGAWSMPDGDAYYRVALRRHTTLDLDPRDVHDWGRTEVDRLQQSLGELLSQAGIANADLAARMQRWAADLEPANGAGTADANLVLRLVEKRMALERDRSISAFPAWADASVLLRTAPAQRSRAAPLALYLSRPGGESVLQLNIRDAQEWSRWNLGPLIRHEYLPGHHLQSVAQQLADLPAFRRSLNWPGFAEGWAMYAEAQRWEGGEWSRDEQIALTHSELLRAVRAVVDPGLHFLRWDRKEAVRYMVEQAAIATRDAEVEVDRYLAWPGQSVSFAVGLRSFREARDQAKGSLGGGFSERAFAQAMLEGGAVPLALVPKRTQDWIDRVAAQAHQAAQ